MKYICVLLFLLFVIVTGCNKSATQLYSDKSNEIIQKSSEEAVRSWINNYAEFPDSYTSLLFEKVKISSAYHKGKEIEPLRRYSVEHTFIIKDKEFNTKHATLVFEMTPDFFIQDIRYRTDGVISIAHRKFPPNYTLWTELYGRNLNNADTLFWNKNNRAVLTKISDSFVFNRMINPEGEDADLSDSLVIQVNKYYVKN